LSQLSAAGCVWVMGQVAWSPDFGALHIRRCCSPLSSDAHEEANACDLHGLSRQDARTGTTAWATRLAPEQMFRRTTRGEQYQFGWIQKLVMMRGWLSTFPSVQSRLEMGTVRIENRVSVPSRVTTALQGAPVPGAVISGKYPASPGYAAPTGPFVRDAPPYAGGPPEDVPVLIAELDGRESKPRESGLQVEQDRLLMRVVSYGGVL
jgi:hypothetical protein